MAETAASADPPRRTRVWDLPTRLFHWTATGLVVFSYVTAKLGGAWTPWHFRSGYALLALLAFRVAWGFAGNRHARFASFVRGPRAWLAYLRDMPAAPGHNPLGGIAVLALLGALLFQATTGLFATDDIFNAGPLAHRVSADTSALLSRLHRWNEWVLIALVTLHVAAVLFYLLIKRRDLVTPMITGDQWHVATPDARDDARLRLRAVALLALCAAAVAALVLL